MLSLSSSTPPTPCRPVAKGQAHQGQRRRVDGWVLLLGGMAACGMNLAMAGGFSAMVSPPHFEDTAAAGTTYRNVVDLINVSGTAGHYTVKTSDWSVTPSGNVEFSDTLAKGSCRPWVGLEAGDLTLGPNERRHYRFEVAVPAGTPDGECRFAIMIEGDPDTLKGSVRLPVSGRIGVVVYVNVGAAKAQLDIAGHAVKPFQGRRLPVLMVHNSGTAHGRVLGLLNGTDASGKTYVFSPSSNPILPGETRPIELTPQADNDTAPAPVLAYPVHLKGRLDWHEQHLDIDLTLT